MYCLEGFAILALATNECRAARLWASVEQLRSTFRVALPPVDRSRYARYIEMFENLQTNSDCQHARLEGQAMTLDHAVAYALIADAL